MNQLFEGSTGEKIRIACFIAVIVLSVFLAVEAVGAFMGLRYIGAGIAATNTIVVSGHGEAFGVPDIATFNFSVVSDKPTVAAAQQDATAKINTITNYLTSAGISKNDIQTSNYSIEPQYTYQSQGCPAAAPGVAIIVPCPPGQQVLEGYEVNQTTTVKVRDTSKAGTILAGIGGQGATEISGLTFTFDNPNSVQEAARNNAIADAKQQATVLAQSLGVSLVRVVSFNENINGNTPIPIAFSTGARTTESVAPAPDISAGQNQVTDDVSITYEIR